MSWNPKLPVPLAALTLLAVALAGCHTPGDDHDGAGYVEMGFDGQHWPRLDGVTLTILDHGAFGAFDDAARAFEELTGAKVEHHEANDAGSALRRAELERGDPTFDILYGVDNVLMHKALAADVFAPYKPLLADRIQRDYVFFDEAEVGWPATPVDHGYIAVNWDPEALGTDLTSLDDLVDHADQFVTEDPRTSTPGLGFLLATIATYGENGHQVYWKDLFENGVLVTSGWTEAYEQHFSGGYGPSAGGLGDKAIVTSYTSSPAYEAYFGATDTARVLTAPESTFHQIETMGIAKGAPNRAAAEAWIEFTLTDTFQDLVAPSMAVYPVVQGADTDSTFGDVDPEPGTFQPAPLDATTIGTNLDRWVRQWGDLCEQHDCI